MTQTHFPYRRPLSRAFSAVQSSPGVKGFSLVEIMVALVIGMIGVLVIMQVARTGETQKRVTAGSGDSQNNGAMGVYSIQRDMKQAGYGISSLNVLGCRLILPSGSLGLLAPATINSADVPAGDDDTDTLLIVYGSSNGSPEGDIITLPVAGTQALGVMSAANFRVGEWAIAAPASPTNGCALMMKEITATTEDTVTIPGLGAQETENLFDLGLAPRVVGYAIRNGNLSTCDYLLADCSDVANWQDIATGIVSLRAQYGHASTSTDGIDSWNRDKPVNSPVDQERFSCKWARISAIRLALVARNSEPARPEPGQEVSPALLDWAGSRGSPPDPTDPPNLGEQIDVDDIGGRFYRYQVYETVMPLRNIPWMGKCTS